MQKSKDLKNNVLNTSFDGLSDEIAVSSAESGSSMPKLAGALTGAAIIALAAGAAEARDTKDMLRLLNQTAIDTESSSEYRRSNPGDLKTGLEYSEQTRALEMDTAFNTKFSIEVLYYLTRGVGSRSASAPFKSLGKSSWNFGTTPINLPVSRGDTIDDALVRMVHSFRPFSVGADADRRDLIVDSMRAAYRSLGRKSELSRVQGQDGSVELPHEVLFAGELARLGYATRVKTKYTAPAATAKKDYETAPAKQHKKKAQKRQKKAQPAATQPAEDAEEKAAEKKPAEKKADPCRNPEFSGSLDEIRSDYKERMSDHDDASDIRTSAKERYDALQKQCPKNADRIAGERSALENALKGYVASELERVRFSLADIGAGLTTGGALRQGVGGHLALGWSTLPAAKEPFGINLYIDGANYNLNDNNRRPFAGAVLRMVGKKFDLQIAWAGEWLNSTSEFSRGPTTVGPTTRTIPKGTETTTETTRESGRNSTEGYNLANWMGSAEGGILLGNFKLEVGFAFGKYSHHELSETETLTSSNVRTQETEPGKPKVTTDTTVNVDTNVRVRTLTDVVTDLFGARLGGLAITNKGRLKIGADATLIYNNSKVSGNVDVDTNVAVKDTVTDITIEGQPNQRFVTPGSTTTDRTSTPITAEEEYMMNVVLRVRVLYRKDNLATRFEIGPSFGSNNDGGFWPAMPLSGNATVLWNKMSKGITLGGNAYLADDKFGLEGLFATTKDFQKFLGYVDMTNQFKTAGLIDDSLRDRYLMNVFDHLVETGDGFVFKAGLSVDSQKNYGIEGAAGYAKQVKGMGPLGVSVSGSSADRRLRAAGYIGLTHGLSLRPEVHTEKDRLQDRQSWGVGGSLVYHLK